MCLGSEVVVLPPTVKSKSAKEGFEDYDWYPKSVEVVGNVVCHTE